jgi:hypothetical protein
MSGDRDTFSHDLPQKEEQDHAPFLRNPVLLFFLSALFYPLCGQTTTLQVFDPG